ncbi:MAG: PilZ domain-containing protein [Desulfotalea sp.]
MTSESSPETIYKQMKRFFPDEVFTKELVKEKVDEEDIFTSNTVILPYLQSALLAEKIVEFKIDNTPRVFFTRFNEMPYPDDDEVKRRPGQYLEEFQSVITLPIEPGIGNMMIRKSLKVVIRIFTSLYAVELGAEFKSVIFGEEGNLLEFSYPTIGRIVRNAREFRAKVPKKMNLRLAIRQVRNSEKINCEVADVSAKGMGVILPRACRKMLEIEEAITAEVTLNGEMLFSVSCRVRHLSKMRSDNEVQFTCGLQLDLASNEQLKAVEGLLAKVQRIYLQDLANQSLRHGVSILP